MILRAPKTIKSIMTMLFVFFLMLGAIPAQALGEPAYEIVGESNGLTIAVQSDYVDTGNLNPGDKKDSSLTLTNTGEDTLTVYIRTDIISQETRGGGYLADVMRLTIKDGDTAVNDDEIFSDAAEKGNIQIGRMAPGAVKILNFHVEFPAELPDGKDLGNEYQGASMNVKWVFTTESSGNGGGDDHDRRDDDDEREPDEPDVPDITVEDEPVPIGPVDEGEPSEPPVTAGDEEIPGGPAMPKTGETSPLYFFAAGAFLAVVGYAVRKK